MNTTTTQSLKQEIDALGPWFHNLHLPDGTQTAPQHRLGDFPNFKWQEISAHIPQDLTGWRVLDVGCNAGFYTLELAKRGASVLGIDVDPHYLRQAEWAAKQFGLEKQVELRQMQVYDVAHLQEQFDLIWYMGVLYHLRYPLLSLDILAQKTRRLMMFQTLTLPGNEQLQVPDDVEINDRQKMLQPGWPVMAFIEKKLAGDITNWWAPNAACVEAMLRSCGLKVLERPGHELYLCAPDPGNQLASHHWNQSELLSATGQSWQEEVKAKVGGKNTYMVSGKSNGNN